MAGKYVEKASEELKVREGALAESYGDKKRYNGPCGEHSGFRDVRYTYADYCTWDDDVRYELIDGVPIVMDAPSRGHQGALGEFFGQLWSFLKRKPCKVYMAPFDVRLNADKEDDTVVQPDVIVVCDESKLNEKGCAGVPDLAIEVLSPSNKRHDTFVKYNKYLHVGIREYWIVDLEEKTVTVNILDKDKGVYRSVLYTELDTVPVHVIDGCQIDLHDVFME